MRVLHVGSGFRPWRRGGLVAYAEDLMGAQVRRGHEVHYFFAGRHYPLLRGPRLRSWQRDGIAMLEVVNSPLYDHGRQPELEIGEPRLEAMLERALAEVTPDVVHVHELAGLPFSLLDVIKRAGVPFAFTLQDYFALCPTFKLLDAEGRVCLRREIGADCVATTAADPRPPGLMMDATVRHHLHHAPVVRSLESARVDRLISRTAERAARRLVKPPPVASAAAFQRRRDVNVERLNRCDCLIAMSTRVAEIYAELGVDPARLRTIHLTLSHIERLTPRRATGAAPVVFATLAGFESAPKGAALLVDAMRRLSEHVREGRCRLLVLGHVDPAIAAAAEGIPGIDVQGPYRADQLDSILEQVDVGIVPSIWEEAYAYAGVEFLAKGIPVIANAIGGMTDYTREGETGWLNRSRSAAELARIMDGLVRDPGQIAELNARLVAERDTVVKPLARHADEMDAVYAELIQARSETVA
jgi:glycosyltransferase involved in cell wall biosynthesis